MNADSQYIQEFAARNGETGANRNTQERFSNKQEHNPNIAKKSQEQNRMSLESEQDHEKSDTLCGRKRTFKNTKLRSNSHMKKSINNGKESDQLIVPDSIQNFKSQNQNLAVDEMSHKVRFVF